MKQEALRLNRAGISCLPADRDQKRPTVRWKQYIETPVTENDIESFTWRSDSAICVLTGSSSGGLNIIDFDQSGILFDQWRESVQTLCEGRDNMLSECVLERTQSGGYHVGYRTERVEGNTELAYLPNGKIAIETRGHGGICLIAPSARYAMIQGDWADPPFIDRELHDIYYAAARSLDKRPTTFEAVRKLEEVEPDESEYLPPVANTPPSPPTMPRNEKSEWNHEDIAERLRTDKIARVLLEENGWEYIKTVGNEEHWKRPGKDKLETGGTLNIDTQCFHCFTSNGAPLEIGKGYTPFNLSATLLFRGSLSEASKYWAREYGVTLGRTYTDNAGSIAIDDPDNNDDPVFTMIGKYSESSESAGAFPQEILDAPGLLKEIATYTNTYSNKYQPILAFAGAFSFVSFALGRRIKYVSGIRPNVYCMAVCGTGMGKDAARKTNKKLLEIYDQDAYDPEQYESRQAFINTLVSQKQLFTQVDEFGQFFQVMTDAKGNINTRQILDEWMKVFTSADVEKYLPRIAARDNSDTIKDRIVCQPFYTMYATSTPGEFFKGITMESIKKGFIPRCFVFEGDDDADFIEQVEEQPEIPQTIADEVEAWHSFRLPNPLCSPDPFVVRPDSKAALLFKEFIVRNNAKQKELKFDEAGAMINTRCIEKTYKAALIFAASKIGPYEDSLIIDEESARLAIMLNDYTTAKMFEWKEQHVSESEIDADIKNVLEWIRKNNGRFSRSQFTLRFQRMGLKAREEILKTLIYQKRLNVKDVCTKGRVRKDYIYNNDR